jgi:hypothetical protein
VSTSITAAKLSEPCPAALACLSPRRYGDDSTLNLILRVNTKNQWPRAGRQGSLDSGGTVGEGGFGRPCDPATYLPNITAYYCVSRVSRSSASSPAPSRPASSPSFAVRSSGIFWNVRCAASHSRTGSST